MHDTNNLQLKFSTIQRRNVKTIVVTTLVTIVIGIVYVIIISDPHPHSVIIGAIDGCLIGLIGTLAELYFFSTYGRRMRFSLLLTLRTVFYVVLISGAIVGVSVHHLSWMYGLTVSEVFAREDFRHYLTSGELVRDVVFVLVVVFVINFVRQINRLLGQNALLNYIMGKYYDPIEEERVFMFVDIKDSTAIAEKLRHKEYHNFLNDFFHDITPAIVESKGEIYQYVGDEVVITWSASNGLQEANCIKCYFRIAASLHVRIEHYRKKYGFVPSFKAGYHFGPVIAGEIGDVKKEIVFHGDTVNTAARIRSECTTYNKTLLLSGDLLSRISVTDYLTPETIGKIRLRGKAEEIELFSIAEAA